jgi:hypothetical protein
MIVLLRALRARACSVVKVHPLTRKAIVQQLSGQFNRCRAALATLFLFLNAEKTLSQKGDALRGISFPRRAPFFDSLIIPQDKVPLQVPVG